MNNEKDILKNLSDNAAKFKLPVEENVWDSIESRIENKKKGFFARYKKFLLLLIPLLFSAGLYFYFQKSESTNTNSKEVEWNYSSKKQQNPSKIVNTTETNIIANNIDNSELLKEEKIKNSNKQELDKTMNSNSKKNGVNKIRSEKELFSSEKNSNINTQSSLKNEINKREKKENSKVFNKNVLEVPNSYNVKPSKRENLISKNETQPDSLQKVKSNEKSDQQSEVLREILNSSNEKNTSSTSNNVSNLVQNDSSKINSSYSSIIDTDSLSINSVSKDNDSVKNNLDNNTINGEYAKSKDILVKPFSILISYGIGWSNRRLQSNSLKELVEHKDKHESGRLANKLGLNLNYHLSPKSILSLGFEYAKYGENYNFQHDIITHETKNEYKYLQFSLAYKRLLIRKGKHGFFVLGGANWSLLTNAKSSWVDTDQLEIISHSNRGSNQPFTNNNVVVFGGIDYTYSLTNRFNFHIFPIYDQFLNSVYKPVSELNQKQYSVTANFGISFDF